MSKKANLDTLYKLHKAVAEYYIDVLDSGEELHGGTLAAINTFLKNNDIKVDLVDAEDKKPLAFKLQELIEAS